MTSISPGRAGTYLYCVARATPFAAQTPPLRASGIGGRGDHVRVLFRADLAAIVSDSPCPRYDLLRSNLLAHERVIEEAHARADVLPVRFGTVARDDNEIQTTLLDRMEERIRQQLDRVCGCVQLTLKAFWNEQRLFADVAVEDGTLWTLREQLDVHQEKLSYHERIQLGETVAQALARKRQHEAMEMLAELERHAVETRLSPLLTDMMVLNAAFLVERDRVADFDVAVSSFATATGDRFIYRYLGPLPPYDFATLTAREREAS